MQSHKFHNQENNRMKEFLLARHKSISKNNYMQITRSRYCIRKVDFLTEIYTHSRTALP